MILDSKNLPFFLERCLLYIHSFKKCLEQGIQYLSWENVQEYKRLKKILSQY